MKKYITAAIIILVFSLSLSAQDFLGTISGSGNTYENNPAEAAIDGDVTTSVRFKPQHDNGWLKISLQGEKRIEYVMLAADIPLSVVAHLQYEENGFVKAFPSSFVTGKNGMLRIDVSEDRIVTDAVYLKLDGREGHDIHEARIHEISIAASEDGQELHLEPLHADTQSKNTSMYTGAQHLVDGMIGTVWWTWNNEDWKSSHWFVLESLDAAYPVQKENNQWNKGFTVLKPQEEKLQKELKVYVSPLAAGVVSITVKGVSGNSVMSNVALDEYRGRWLTVNAEDIGAVTEVRLDVAGSAKTFGGIGEVELWGQEDPPRTVHEEIIPFIPGSGLDYGIFNISSLSFTESYRLEVLVDTQESEDITTKVNGTAVPAIRTQAMNGFIRLRYVLDDRNLSNGDNILEVLAPAGSTVLQAQMTKVARDAVLELEYSSLTDERLYSGGATGAVWLSFVQGKSKADSIKFYYDDTAPTGVYCKYMNQVLYPSFVKDTGTYVEYSIDAPITGIGMRVPGGTTEVVAVGHPLETKKPRIKLLFPSPGQSLLHNETTFKPFWGITDMPGAEITINGQAVKKYGNYFWLEPPKKNGEVTGELNVEAKLYFNNEVFTDAVTYVVQSESYEFTIDQEDILYRTHDAVFTISGSHNPWVASVFVNGEKAGAANQSHFSYNLPLQNGLNIARIELKDKNGVSVKEIHTRRILKEPLSRQLIISAPTEGTVLNTESVSVSGYASPYGLESVEVNGVEAVLLQGRYHATVPVYGSETVVQAVSTYNDGEELTSQVTVYRDTDAPVIEDVTPLPESWHAKDVIEFEGHVYDAHSTAVFVNGKKADVLGTFFSIDLDAAEYENEITIRAIDAAGNITEYPSFWIYVDLSQPEPFDVAITPDGWTNETRPVIQFATTDSYSQISHYEVSVDGHAYNAQKSPFQLPFLPDGRIQIVVRAIDNVGNYRDAEVTAYIDTMPPDEPTAFRAVPGNGNATLRWSDDDDETVSYVVSLQDGSTIEIDRDEYLHHNDETDADSYEYFVPGLENGEAYIFDIYAIDHAGNTGQSLTDSIITGITIETYDREEGTIVEYEDVFVLMPRMSLPEEVEEIIVTEIISAEMTENSVNPIVSPIFDFSVLKNDASHAEHVSFEEKFFAEIEYDETLIPEGFPEQNLGVYFFDTNWSKWFKVKESIVDLENNKIYFKTDHFSSFSVQPTVFNDLSPQELSDVEFSPYSSKVKHEPVSVSMQGGSASTSMTEMVLPGKNGFDFELRRIYDTTTARGDAAGLSVNVSVGLGDILSGEVAKQLLVSGVFSVASQIESSVKKFFENNGDYAYALGQGWRLNLPYIRGANGGVLVRTPSGSFYDIMAMDLRVTDSFEGGIARSVTFENHEGEDFVLVIQQFRSDVSITNIVGPLLVKQLGLNNDYDPEKSKDPQYPGGALSVIPGWSLVGGKLIMKDGSTYFFDNLGRFDKSVDPTGMNEINAEYNFLLLDTITDSMGRAVKFEYTNPLDSFGDDIMDASLIPQIKKIWVENDPLLREINYEYGNPANMQSELNLIAPVRLPLLKKATDIGGREWDYDYDFRFLFAGGFGAKINLIAGAAAICTGGAFEKVANYFGLSALTLSAYATSQWVFPMDFASGSGIGSSHIDYHTKTLGYIDFSLADYFLGIIPTAVQAEIGMEQRVMTDRLRVFLGEELFREENYSYDFKYAGDKMNYVGESVKDDGVIKTLNTYEIKRKTRGAVFDWSDYLVSYVTNPFGGALWREDIIPLEKTSTLYDSVTGKFIQSTEKEYYTANLQPKMIKTSRSDDYYTLQNYVYDEWGNQAKISTDTKLGDRTTKSVTYNLFYDNGDDPAALGEVTWDAAQNDSLVLEEGLSERHNLLLGTQTINYDTYHAASITSAQYHSYDSHGQLVKSRVEIAEDQWAETSHTYGYSAPLTGERTSTTNPIGHVTERDYDFSLSDVYTVVETQNDVANSVDASVSDIVTTKVYDRTMGYLKWSTDGRGYTTEYGFDKLGRTTKILFPDDDTGEQNWDPLSGAAIDRTDNPLTTVVYDDADLTVTETKRNGSEVLYTFDNLTRLKEISKLNGTHVSVFEYDSHNNITSYTNANSDVTSFTYNPLGQMTSETYLEKNKAVEQGGSDITRMKTISYDYKTLGKTIVNERGIRRREYTDFNDKPLHAINYGLYGEEYSHEYTYYDGLGNVVAVIDPNGNETRTVYNPRNLVERTITPACEYLIDGTAVNTQVYTRFTYDDAGNKTDEHIGYDSSDVRHINYAYDGLGRVTVTTHYWNDIDGILRTAATATAYDANGNVTVLQDPRNNQWVKTYTPRNKLETETDPLGNITSYGYDTSDRMTQMIDPRANSGNYPALDFSILYTYDNLDRLTLASIPARINPVTGTLGEKPAVSFTYDNMNNVLTRTEPDSAVTTYSYSQRKKVLSETKSNAALPSATQTYTTWNEYDAAGNLLKTTLPDLVGYTSYTYDALNRVSSQTTNGNSQMRYGYDKNGNRTVMVTPNGYYHYFTYDGMNRLIEEKDEESFTTYTAYDVLGNVAEYTDAIGNTFTSGFDEAGHLMQEEDGRGMITEYRYDLAGNLIRTDDPSETMITNTYLSNNLLASTVFTNASSADQNVSYVYDEAGAVKQITDSGITTRYNYIDGVYRPDPYDMKFSVETQGHSTVGYTYDIMNRMTGITYDQGMTVSYAYNNMSQLTQVSGYITGVTYNANGLKDTTTYANGMTLSYAFTDRQELDTITYAASASTLKTYDYAYDLAGNVIAENQNLFAYDGKNQMVTAMIISSAAEEEYELDTVFTGEKEYDVLGDDAVAWHEPEVLPVQDFSLDWGARSLGIGLDYSYRVKRIVLHRKENTPYRVEKSNISVHASLYNREDSFITIDSFTFEKDDDTGDLIITFPDAIFGRIFKIHSHFNDLDEDGNPRNINAELELASEDPIEVYAVTAGRNEFYEYDGKGNRQSKTIMSEGFEVTDYIYYTGSDLVRTDGEYGYLYDDNGNMTEKGVLLDDSGTTPLIDRSATGYFRYVYDLKNRLKEVHAYTDGQVQKVAEYLYDAHNLRIQKMNAEGSVTRYVFDTGGNLLKEHVSNEPAISYVHVNGRHVARVTETETLYYGLNNVGTTIFMADDDAEIVWSGDITPYGDSQTSTDTTIATVAYTGKQIDPDSGLYYFNNRWYDPYMGRFITQDPIRDGQNWYIYCSNNPIIRIDPTGLDDFRTYWSRSTNRLFAAYHFTDELGNITRVKLKYYKITNKLTPKKFVEYNGYWMKPQHFPSSPEGGWNLTESYLSENNFVQEAIKTDAKQEIMTYKKYDDDNFDIDENGNAWIKVDGKLIPLDKNKGFELWADTNSKASLYVEDKIVTDDGYYVHEGDGDITWGCLKGSEEDIKELQAMRDSAVETGGEATLEVLE